MRKKIAHKNWFVLGLLLVGLHTQVAFAQLSSSDREAVQRYRTAVGAAKSGTSGSALETAFSALARLREALLGVRGEQTVLESLSEQQFADLQQQLPGVLIGRDEVVVVDPDADYFRRLAATNGGAADRAFFDVLKATYPDGWPVYVERQTDYSGCTRFGSATLVGTYRAWTDFQRMYPGRYAAAAQAEAKAVLDNLATSTCSCGDAAGVQAEFQRFVQQFPDSPARAVVERRLKAARAGHSGIRTQCLSG